MATSHTNRGNTDKKSGKHDIHALKPGSSREDAKQVAGSGDFGAKAGGNEDRVERDYVSTNTKRSDPGNAQPLSHEEIGGERVAGVGGVDAGEGSSSGGDLDPDIVGLDGRGLASSAPSGKDPGKAASDGTSREFASGGPGNRAPEHEIGAVGGDHDVKGSTVTQPDVRTGRQSSDQVDNSDGAIDNSFVGEISSAEGDGRDQRGE